jgi:hypothetical protein
MNVHMIWCFRAKNKLEFKKGKEPRDLGFMSIAGSEMIYEFQLQALLYPGSGGVPTWRPDLPGERMMAKLPKQFGHIFKENQQLSEDIGEQLAKWARGGHQEPAKEQPEKKGNPFEWALKDIRTAPDWPAVGMLAKEFKVMKWSEDEEGAIRAAIIKKKEEFGA